MNLFNLVYEKLKDAFEKAGFADTDILLRLSDRPDISDYQANGALSLAKKLGQNPREIATQIVQHLTDDFFAKVSVDGPGFINLTLSDNTLTKNAFSIFSSQRFGFTPKDGNKRIVVDYGNPNVAKILHAGHIPSANLGNSVIQLCRFAGDFVVGENYLGDWGRPMGLMIAAMQERFPDLPYFDENAETFPTEAPFTNDDLIQMYPEASARIKTDEAFLNKARENTRLLQEGHKGYRALWKQFLNISIENMKKTYGRLGIEFDVWTGESAAYEGALALADTLKKEGVLKLDDGAWVIPLEDEKTNAPLPPLLMVNSTGGTTYAAADLSTLKRRCDTYHPDVVMYSVDARQSLHFRQVFGAAKKIGLATNVSLENFAFGTICGPDHKPFKTRDGGVMSLDSLIDTVVNSVKKRMDAGEIGKDLSDDEKPVIAEKVGVSALKYAGLMNDKIKDCVLDIDKITQIEGKTGPYILYGIVRMRSVLQKAGVSKELTETPLVLTNPAERSLLLRLYAFPEIIQSAYDNRAPHIIADYLFKLIQDFNLFYHDCPILTGSDDNIKQSRLALLKYTLALSETMADILGLMIPEKM